MKLPEKVTIIEVSPRDGLQNERLFVDTRVKRAFIEKLAGAGFKEMEITSFVSPKWVPQMADAADIVKSSPPGIRGMVLAPNEKGIERAIASGCKAIAVFVGVSSSFNRKNINRSTRDSMLEWKPLISNMKKRGLFVRACISTAFHCPFEGKVPEADTLTLCSEFETLGVDELSVADTIGMATPLESFTLFTKLKQQLPHILLTAHFHDTWKMGLANIFASLQAGIDRFDTSAGGLGGCPFAPGASGNVATEDVVHMLEKMNIRTGIDLAELVKAIDIIAPALSRPIETGYYQLAKSGQLNA